MHILAGLVCLCYKNYCQAGLPIYCLLGVTKSIFSRVPELLFEPSMIGLEQAGIAETMDYMFKKFTPEDQNRLAQYVFLTGSNANFPNLLERISKELLEMRPFQSTFNVFKAGM